MKDREVYYLIIQIYLVMCKSNLQFEHQIVLASLYSHFISVQELPHYPRYAKNVGKNSILFNQRSHWK